MAEGNESTVWAIMLIGATILSSLWVFRDEPAMASYGIALAGWEKSRAPELLDHHQRRAFDLLTAGKARAVVDLGRERARDVVGTKSINGADSTDRETSI